MSTEHLSQDSSGFTRKEDTVPVVSTRRMRRAASETAVADSRAATGHGPGSTVAGAADLRGVLERSPIIPAIRVDKHIPAAISSPSSIIFLMCGTPATVDKLVWRLKQQGKLPIVNLDLLPGFARDTYAVEFLAEAGAAGVISTHQHVLRAARNLGLIAVQRTFAIDSAALGNCLRRLHDFVPDVLELLPAFAGPVVLPKLRDACPNLLVIGCGLVTSVKEAENLVQQGLLAVSVHDPALWVV